MRTTVTLDADVVAKLKAATRQHGISFKQALNDAIRAGLDPARRSTRHFTQPTQPMSLRARVNIDKALRLASTLEDEGLVHKLQLHK